MYGLGAEGLFTTFVIKNVEIVSWSYVRRGRTNFYGLSYPDSYFYCNLHLNWSIIIQQRTLVVSTQNKIRALNRKSTDTGIWAWDLLVASPLQ